jgi:hypothetical protein
MGFDLLSFAGGFAESSMARMDTAEKEAKEFALASTKNMYKKYSDRLDEDKVLLKETVSDMAAIQRNFVGKNAFTKEQLSQIAASPSNRKALVEAINSGTMNFDNINPAQMVTLVEKNTAPIAMDKLLQAGQLDQTLNKKLTEQSTFGQMYKGFYTKGAESAGKAVEEKTARAFGTTVEEMQNKLAETPPEATATFDFTGLRKETTFVKRLEDAAAAVGKHTASGDTAALAKANEEFNGLAAKQLAMNKALKGDDYAQKVLDQTNKTTLVLSKPSNFSEQEVADAKAFRKFQLDEEKAMAAARRGPTEPKDAEVHIGTVVGTAVKDVVGAVTFKAPSGTEMVMNPVLGGKAVKADSREGIAIRQDAIDTRAKAVLFAGGSLNADGSVKTNKAAQAIAAYGVSTYTDDNGKLFIGSKPAPVDVDAGKTPDKPLPVPTSAQALKTGTYYATQKGVALWTGEKFDDTPAAGAPAAAPVAAPPKPSGAQIKPGEVVREGTPLTRDIIPAVSSAANTVAESSSSFVTDAPKKYLQSKIERGVPLNPAEKVRAKQLGLIKE